MNLTMMLFLPSYSPASHPLEDAGAGPSTPRPVDPSPDGGAGEPVGDDDEDDEVPASATAPRPAATPTRWGNFVASFVSARAPGPP